MTDQTTDRPTGRRGVRIEASWPVIAVLAVFWAAVLVGVVALVSWASRPAPVDPLTDRVRAVCERYASLDLSDLAPLCKAVGYQQQVYLVPPGGTSPEDLERSGG